MNFESSKYKFLNLSNTANQICAFVVVNKQDEDREQSISLRLANKELLADRINQKYKHYIGLNGIPADEIDEFTNLHFAYKALGGNHSGDAKYHYVMEHLPVIPVEVNLVCDNKE